MGKLCLQLRENCDKILSDSVRGSDERPCACCQVGRENEVPGGNN